MTKQIVARSPREVYNEIRRSYQTAEFRLGFHLGLIVTCFLAALVLAVFPLI